MRKSYLVMAIALVSLAGCALATTAKAAEAKTAKGLISLKVDLALPTSGKDLTPLPGTLKLGWSPFVAPGWADMYLHDGTWENGSQGTEPPKTKGIAGSGVHVKIDAGRGGNGGFYVHGMCRAEGGKTTGKPKGGPIANGWFHNIKRGGDFWSDILLRINGLPAGEYEMTMYHNHWEAKSEETRNCLDQKSKMPNMARIYAIPLPSDAEPDYAENWSMGEGTDGGVKSIKSAKKVKVTSALFDEDVSKSVIGFKTDGTNDVLVVIAGSDASYEDPAGGEGGGCKAILNAFEIKQVK